MLKRKKAKLVLGLTGTIGSGKSTVARLFKTKDSLLIDADKLAHDSLESAALFTGRLLLISGRGYLSLISVLTGQS